MTPEDINLIKRIATEIVRKELSSLLRSDAYVFEKPIKLAVGSSIGLSTTDKIGFYRAASASQASAITAAPATNNDGSAAGGFVNKTERETAVAAINSIITVLENIGLVAPN